METMRVFVCGDTHGNTRFVEEYLYPVAAGLQADVILQLGDYGFWEHTEAGVLYNDEVGALAKQHGIPFCFIRGNHDNIELLRERYHRPEFHDSNHGFYRVRQELFHVPDGARWEWAGVRFAAFGGAYSVDKADRLRLEQKRHRVAWAKEQGRREQGLAHQPVATAAGTLWFPGEELTDDEVDAMLAADPTPADIVVSHDMPRSSCPGPGFKDLPGCLPNQNRLQRVLRALRPKIWLHGHLHHAYTVSVPNTERYDGPWTTVRGLSCDDLAAPRFWRPWQAWALLDLGVNGVPIQLLDHSNPAIGDTVDAIT